MLHMNACMFVYVELKNYPRGLSCKHVFGCHCVWVLQYYTPPPSCCLWEGVKSDRSYGGRWASDDIAFCSPPLDMVHSILHLSIIKLHFSLTCFVYVCFTCVSLINALLICLTHTCYMSICTLSYTGFLECAFVCTASFHSLSGFLSLDDRHVTLKKGVLTAPSRHKRSCHSQFFSEFSI